MIIRQATVVDAAAVAHVHVAGWQTTYRQLLPAEFLENLSEATSQARWEQWLDGSPVNGTVFVAVQHEMIVGFIHVGPERTGDASYLGEVIALYLLEECRGQGIGSALFRQGVAELRQRQLNSMKVWVLRDNPHRSFYLRQGGQFLEETSIVFGGVELQEWAYGWTSLENFGN